MDFKGKLDRVGDSLVDVFQLAALLVIGATIVWSAAHAYIEMMQAGSAKLDEILLLFLYLELGAIVGIYFNPCPCCSCCWTSPPPSPAVVLNSKKLDVATIIAVTASILLLTLAVLVLQIAASRFAPSNGRAAPHLDIEADPAEAPTIMMPAAHVARTRRVADTQLPTRWGMFRLVAYEREVINSARRVETAVALMMGDATGGVPLVRIHSQCFTGEILGSLRCDWQRPAGGRHAGDRCRGAWGGDLRVSGRTLGSD